MRNYDAMINSARNLRKKIQAPLAKVPMADLRDVVEKMIAGIGKGEFSRSAHIDGYSVDFLAHNIRTAIIINPISISPETEAYGFKRREHLEMLKFHVITVHAKEILRSPEELRQKLYYSLLQRVRGLTPR